MIENASESTSEEGEPRGAATSARKVLHLHVFALNRISLLDETQSKHTVLKKTVKLGAVFETDVRQKLDLKSEVSIDVFAQR